MVIRGDGIGPEIVDATCSVLDAVGARHGLAFAYDERAGGRRQYLRSGTPLGEEAMAAIRVADAVLKGPVGLPEVRLPDGTEAGLLGGVLRTGSTRTPTCAPCCSSRGSSPDCGPSRGRSTTRSCARTPGPLPRAAASASATTGR